MSHRTAFAVALFSLISPPASALFAQDRPAPSSVPDPRWRPAVGDRVTVIQPGTAGLPNLAACERYTRFLRANDATGLRELAGSPGAVAIPAGSSVLVVQVHGLPTPRFVGGTTTLEGFREEVQDAVTRSAVRPDPVVSVEVRVLDGPARDALRFVSMDSLARMMTAPDGPTLHPGDRGVVVAPSIPMGRDEETFLQYTRHPEAASNRAYAYPLNKGAKLVILDVNEGTYRVKVHSGSKLAGRVGFVKFGGIEPVPAEVSKTKPRGR